MGFGWGKQQNTMDIINDIKHYTAWYTMGTERLVTLSVPSSSVPIVYQAVQHLDTSFII